MATSCGPARTARGALLAIVGVLLCQVPVPAQDRGIRVPTGPNGQWQALYTGSYALLIGVSRYDNAGMAKAGQHPGRTGSARRRSEKDGIRPRRPGPRSDRRGSPAGRSGVHAPIRLPGGNPADLFSLPVMVTHSMVGTAATLSRAMHPIRRLTNPVSGAWRCRCSRSTRGRMTLSVDTCCLHSTAASPARSFNHGIARPRCR